MVRCRFDTVTVSARASSDSRTAGCVCSSQSGPQAIAGHVCNGMRGWRPVPYFKLVLTVYVPSTCPMAPLSSIVLVTCTFPVRQGASNGAELEPIAKRGAPSTVTFTPRPVETHTVTRTFCDAVGRGLFSQMKMDLP